MNKILLIIAILLLIPTLKYKHDSIYYYVFFISSFAVAYLSIYYK